MVDLIEIRESVGRGSVNQIGKEMCGSDWRLI